MSVLLTRRRALVLGGAVLATPITPVWADGIILSSRGAGEAPPQGIRVPSSSGGLPDPHRDQVASTPVHFAAAASPQTLGSLNVSSGLTNAFLIAGIALTNARPISSVTWGAQTMTAIGSLAGTTATAYLYGLIAPTAGTQTLTVTWTGGTATGNIFAVSYKNINQTTPTYGFASASGTSAAPAISVSSSPGDVCVDCATMIGQASLPLQTKLTIDNAGTWGFGMSEAAGSASVMFHWTNSSSSAWVDIACALKDGTVGACSNSLNFTQACNSAYVVVL